MCGALASGAGIPGRRFFYMVIVYPTQEPDKDHNYDVS